MDLFSANDGPRVLVIGPGLMDRPGHENLVDTTSHGQDWNRALSPFALGPVPLYGGRRALRMENGWQFAKVYADQVDEAGEPTRDYWRWAEAGWASSLAQRYPRGKGVKPVYSLWQDEKLDYLQARQRIYWPLYRDAVAKTSAFERLAAMLERDGVVTLFDFDGRTVASLGDAILDPRRPMGHAFVLKAMLLYGPSVTVEEVLRREPPTQAFEAPAARRQRALF